LKFEGYRSITFEQKGFIIKTTMKNILLSSMLTLLIISGFSQKVFTEGVVQYKVSVINGKDQPGIADAFDGASQTVWMKASQVRVDFTSPLRLQSTLFEAKDGSVVILKESGKEKYMMNLSKDQWGPYNHKYQGVQFSYLNESKTVAGYNCKKAVATLKDGGQIIVYYAPDLIPFAPGYEYAFKDIPGLPLEYEVTMGKITVKYSAASIQTTPVAASKFDLPKSGYKILEYKQQ
jgi:GLPGLI family protein